MLFTQKVYQFQEQFLNGHQGEKEYQGYKYIKLKEGMYGPRAILRSVYEENENCNVRVGVDLGLVFSYGYECRK